MYLNAIHVFSNQYVNTFKIIFCTQYLTTFHSCIQYLNTINVFSFQLCICTYTNIYIYVFILNNYLTIILQIFACLVLFQPRFAVNEVYHICNAVRQRVNIVLSLSLSLSLSHLSTYCASDAETRLRGATVSIAESHSPNLARPNIMILSQRLQR